MKTFELESYGTTHKIQLNLTAYSYGGGLAIMMTDWERDGRTLEFPYRQPGFCLP